MIKSKVFQSGNSQAVRIPKEFQVEDSELFIQKVGHSLILTATTNPFSAFRESLNEFSEDFMADGRKQPDNQDRDII
ncbi:MAG: antitoxin VapB [Cyclobacteriaceae bacterium]|jgi:antitoxin VapB